MLYTLTPPPTFDDVMSWVKTSSANHRVKTICKLRFQASVYLIWKERNTRYHTSVSRSVPLIIKDMFIFMTAKLYGLDQKEKSASASVIASRNAKEHTFSIGFDYFNPRIKYSPSSWVFHFLMLCLNFWRFAEL